MFSCFKANFAVVLQTKTTIGVVMSAKILTSTHW